MCMCLNYITIKLRFNQKALDLCIFMINSFFLFSIQKYLNDAYQTTLLIQIIY